MNHIIKLRSRSMHLSPDLIWHPKFSVINRLNEFSAVDEVLNQAEINYEGMVKWARNIRVRTDCEMNIVDFPYDSQSCPITISSQDNSNEFLKMSTRKWNRLNDVDENEISVSPTDIDTIKVSNIKCMSYTVYVNSRPTEQVLGTVRTVRPVRQLSIFWYEYPNREH